MILSRDRIGALLLLAFSIGYGALTFEIHLLPFQAQAAFTARSMPLALTVLGVIFALLLLINPGSADKLDVAGFRWSQGGLLCLVMLAYGFGVRPLGFLISTSLFLIAGFLILGERRAWLLFGASVPVVVFFWVLMTQFLGVYIAPWPAFLEG